MAHRQKRSHQAGWRLSILLLTAIAVVLASAPIAAWAILRTASLDNRLETATLPGLLQLWACDGREADGGGFVPEKGSLRLLDDGAQSGESGVFLNETKWRPGRTAVKYLLIRNYDAVPHEFRINFTVSGGLLCEAIEVRSCVEAAPSGGSASALDGIAPVCGTVAAAGAKDFAEAPVRFEFRFSHTASALYAAQTAELEVSASLGQDSIAGRDRRLSIRSVESLGIALSCEVGPDGGWVYNPACDPDRPEYVGNLQDPYADRRARLGDTLYFTGDFALRSTFTLRKQLNLCFAGTLRLSEGGGFVIDIPQELAYAGPMDFGSGDGFGIIVGGGLCRAVSAPEQVEINWFAGVCGPPPEGAQAPGLRTVG